MGEASGKIIVDTIDYTRETAIYAIEPWARFGVPMGTVVGSVANEYEARKAYPDFMSLPALLIKSSALVAMFALAGCATLNGPTFGSPQSAQAIAANSSIRALEGGLISRIEGLKISDQDRLTALKTEYKALESAPGGQELVWQGTAMTGTVVAAAPFQVGSQNCRQYRQSVIVQGQTLSTTGTACRNDSGTWTPL